MTSSYLNSLHKDGLLIKINIRPVHFIALEVVEEDYFIKLAYNEYLSLEELDKLLRTPDCFNDYNNLIGYDQSLSYAISQIKGAISYPPNGLGLLVRGPKGSGKTEIIKSTFNYMVSKSLLDSDAKLVYFKCQLDDDIRFQKEVFGYYDEVKNQEIQGLIDRDKKIYLCIRDIDKLSASSQAMLANFISNKSYTLLGKTNKQFYKNTKIVLTTSKRSLDDIRDSLLVSLPVITDIPSLSERGFCEKASFINSFFKNERRKTNKDILISKNIYDAILNKDFEQNVDELEKTIKNLCAGSYDEYSNEVKIGIKNVPKSLLADIDLTLSKSDFYVDATSYNIYSDDFFDNLSNILKDFKNHEEIIPAKMLDETIGKINQLQSFLSRNPILFDSRYDVINQVVSDIFCDAKKRFEIYIPKDYELISARFIYLMVNKSSKLRNLDIEYSDVLNNLSGYLEKHLPKVNQISLKMIKHFNDSFSVKVSPLCNFILAMGINQYNNLLKVRDTIGFVICHGISTATSICDAVNSLLKDKVFEGINMPLDSTVSEVWAKLNEIINDKIFIKNIVIMVDMGSLESVQVDDFCKVNVGVINGVSTNLALNVGFKIAQGLSLEKIIKEAVDESKIVGKIIKKRNRRKAILISSDVGDSISKKILKLFKSSINFDNEIELITYPFNELKRHLHESAVYEEYDVVLNIVPKSIHIKNHYCLAVEDMVSDVANEIISNSLKSLMSEENFEKFNVDLIKNFSLGSLIENLTILNASQLLNCVSDSIFLLQNRIDININNKALYGIYMHTCLLIERLVTKQQDEFCYDFDLDNLSDEVLDFIVILKESFTPITKKYSIEIPLAEGYLIYEYIYNSHKQK